MDADGLKIQRNDATIHRGDGAAANCLQDTCLDLSGIPDHGARSSAGHESPIGKVRAVRIELPRRLQAELSRSFHEPSGR